jgi:hypothetical protein
MSGRMRRSRLWVALVGVAVAVGGGGVAYATGAIGGSPDVIVGCAKNVNGQLRIVNDASECLTSEHAVAFAAPQAPTGPQSVLVDCAAGQSVQQALADTMSASSVDIAIKGTCTEAVQIGRDDVNLHGVSAGDGLQAPSPGATVLQLGPVRQINVFQLTLSGGAIGLSAGPGATFNANNLTVTGSSNIGVLVDNASAGFLNNSTIDGAGDGIGASGASAIGFNGGTIKNSVTNAVHANNGGHIQLSGGVLVTDTGFHGVVAQTGGSVEVQQATVQNSNGTGVFAFQGGSVHVTQNALIRNNRFGGVGANAGSAEVDGHVTGNGGCGVCGYNGGHLTVQDGALIDANLGDGVQAGVGSTVAVQRATITNNTNSGIHLQGTASAGFDPNNTITGNGQWGIFCDGPPAVAQIQAPQGVGTISGNAAGSIHCP